LKVVLNHYGETCIINNVPLVFENISKILVKPILEYIINKGKEITQ
jgi:hypothetical protein